MKEIFILLSYRIGGIIRYAIQIIGIIILSLGLAGWIDLDEARVIRVGFYENQPKIYTAVDGTVSGFWADLINAIAEEEGWEIVWVHGTWEECLQRLESNEIDLMPDVGWTEQRSEKYAFSNETVLVSWARIYVPQNSNIESILDLDGKMIAGLKGSLNFDGPEGIKDLASRFGIECTFVEMNTYDEVFQALENKQVDAGVTNKDFGNQNEQNYAVDRTPIIIQPSHLQFALPKNAELTPYLIEKIDFHIKAFKSDPDSVYYQALDTYLGENSTKSFVEIIPSWIYNLFMIGGSAILFLVAVNIAARRRVQQQTAELRKSEERYQTLARVSPVGIFRTDVNGSTTYVNPTWCHISGLSAEEGLGDGWLKAVHPEDREIISKNWREAAQHQTASLADYRFIHPDGSVAWVIGQAVPEMNSNNEVVGYIGTITDITDRKEIESALQRSIASEREALVVANTIQSANFALSQSLDLDKILDLLLDYLSRIVPFDAARVMLLETDHRITICATRGYEKPDQINHSYLDSKSNTIINAVITGSTSLVIPDTREFSNWEHTTGMGNCLSWLGIPLIAGGQILGLYSLEKSTPGFFTPEHLELAEAIAAQAAIAIQNARLHNELKMYAAELERRVTERTDELAKRVSEVETLNSAMVTLMEELKEALKKAESADRLKSAFLATMSHELRTPLNSIIGFSGILLQKMVGPLSDEQEKQLRMVQSSAFHLLELINDILDISKIEADQLKIGSENFDMGTAIQKSMDKIRPMAEKKGLVLTHTVNPAVIEITSDRRRVEQVLINLLNNAVKFTDQGMVHLESHQEKDRVITKVSDTGIGIKDEDMQSLFKPFKQVDIGISRQYEGTGLGLSICKRLIELMGGEIWVESEPGKGSIFTFTLPLHKGEDEK